jgi:hypothetical protein
MLFGSARSLWRLESKRVDDFAHMSDEELEASCLWRQGLGAQTMRADEYIRLQAACVAIATQSQTLDVRVRWAKLADAASVAAHAGLAMARNRGAGREQERKIPVAIQARFPNRTAPLRLTISRAQQKAPSSGSSRGQV